MQITEAMIDYGDNKDIESITQLYFQTFSSVMTCLSR